MAWIELHQASAWHRKTIGLAKSLGVRRNEAFGALNTLWLWAVEHAQDGHIGHLTDREVAAAAGWHGRPDRFVLGLHDNGWLDDDGALHDWHDYAGRLIEQRKADIERKRKDRDEREKQRRDEEERRRNGRGKSGGRSGG